jgi:hypothetical protein
MLTATPTTESGITLQVLTNQLYIEFPNNWTQLLEGYSIWRYRLSEAQDRHRRFADKNFYGRFTNAYKNQFDRPFYYYTFDEPQAALYSLLPHGHQPEPWLYRFGSESTVQAEEIVGEIIAPDEAQPHVLLKLMMALCFYEASPNDRDRRVCQSKFYLRVKGKAGDKFFTAVEIKPSVADHEDGYLMTLAVEAGMFAKVRSADDRTHTETGTYYELFDSRGQTYLRQIRPEQVAQFTGDLYKPFPLKGKKAKAVWHTDRVSYKESRSYLVRHVQERLMTFMATYGFRLVAAEETMHRQPTLNVPLPLQRLERIQVYDNRLNTDHVPIVTYLNWLNAYQFPTGGGLVALPFELVGLDHIDRNRPLLVLQDAGAAAFSREDPADIGLLAAQGIEDPYQVLYKRLPEVVKQTLNVNLNQVDDFAVAADYLRYSFVASSLRPNTNAYKEASVEQQAKAKQALPLGRNLEVCLSELWLKWVVTGKVICSPSMSCLPYLSQLGNEWGFMTDNTLLFFANGAVQFADLDQPEGRKVLRERFMAYSELRKWYMARTRYNEKKTDINLPKTNFVLVGNDALELECTPVMAMPNWPVINAIKAEDAAKSARSREAIGVYAGGIWYGEAGNRYIVSGTESSAGTEERGHHIYHIHQLGQIGQSYLSTLRSLLTVTFVRKNRFTVLPYPFDLIRLHRELVK